MRKPFFTPRAKSISQYNYGNYGGPSWGIDQDDKYGEHHYFAGVKSKSEVASENHDLEDKQKIKLAAYNWIYNIWSRENVEMGPIGQAYRLIGTIPFFIYGTVEIVNPL